MIQVSSAFLGMLVLFLAVFCVSEAKIYERCELARELRDFHEIPEKQIATWVCIARHESEFNTSARNHGSGDHGLFQISQLFWCSPPGYACGIPCEDLRNDDIEDDVICARRIYSEHKRLSGDGFNAWVVYNQHCRNKDYVNQFLEGCFDESTNFLTRTNEAIIEDSPLPTVDYYPHLRKKTTVSPITKTTALRVEKPTSTSDRVFGIGNFLSSYKPVNNRFFGGDKTTTNNNKGFVFTTKSVQITKANLEFEKNTAKTTVIESSTQPDQFGRRLLKPVEDNRDFSFSIRKTGYSFSRKN